jgi:trk system potassium uptake protein TrkH
MSARSTFQSTILPITGVFAGIGTIFSVAMLAPLLLAFDARDPGQPAFLRSALTVFVPAVIVWLAARRFRRELRVRDGILLVTLIWAILPALAAMPLLIGIPGLSFTGAYFESVSGLTTTGATVVSGLDQLPASTGSAAWASLFWRLRFCHCSVSAECSSIGRKRRGP